jgi:hypothetical protein
MPADVRERLARTGVDNALIERMSFLQMPNVVMRFSGLRRPAGEVLRKLKQIFSR